MEQDRHKKRDDCSETNPRRECHYRKPVQLPISGSSENRSDVVRQPAQDGHDAEAEDYGQEQPVKTNRHLREKKMKKGYSRSHRKRTMERGMIENAHDEHDAEKRKHDRNGCKRKTNTKVTAKEYNVGNENPQTLVPS